jgi:hypothetical protein
MTAGLPGTGIGGIFYLLLAVGMPICEIFKIIHGKTSFKRWGIIILQLFFVIGIFATMWGEVWALNRFFVWLKQSYSINCPTIGNSTASFEETKTLAFTSGMASIISLSVVILTVHLLNIYFNHIRKGRSSLDSNLLHVSNKKSISDFRKSGLPHVRPKESNQPALN